MLGSTDLRFGCANSWGIGNKQVWTWVVASRSLRVFSSSVESAPHESINSTRHYPWNEHLRLKPTISWLHKNTKINKSNKHTLHHRLNTRHQCISRINKYIYIYICSRISNSLELRMDLWSRPRDFKSHQSSKHQQTCGRQPTWVMSQKRAVRAKTNHQMQQIFLCFFLIMIYDDHPLKSPHGVISGFTFRFLVKKKHLR